MVTPVTARVPEALSAPDTESCVAEVVARVEVPSTVRVPVTTWLVVVALTEVRPVKLPLVAEKLVVKKLVEVELSATRLVM